MLMRSEKLDIDVIFYIDLPPIIHHFQYFTNVKSLDTN